MSDGKAPYMQGFNETFGKVEPKLRRRIRRELKKKYAAGFLDGLLKVLGPGDLCIDLGGNVGEVTGPLADTGAQVITFEPDPYAFAALSQRVAGKDNVTLIQKAAGAEAGSVLFHKKPGTEDQAAVSGSIMADASHATAEGTMQVDCVDFVDFLETTLRDRGPVAFLKMDIEGAELPLLERLVETELLTQVRATVVETHAWMMPGTKPRYEAIRARAAERPDFNLDLSWI